MATIFNDQATLAGTKIGISSGKALGIKLMALGFVIWNTRHMGNAITSAQLDADSSAFLYISSYLLAACLALLDIPVTEELVTKKAKGENVVGLKVLVFILSGMACAAGVYSITSDAEKKDSHRESYTTQESSFEDSKTLLKLELKTAKNLAQNFDTKEQRDTESLRAETDYYSALSTLKKEQSKHQITRPTEAVTTGSFVHWLWAIGFSILCSAGIVVTSAYLTKYHNPLTEIPRVFFRVKDQQEWQMNDDDVRVIPAQVDLSNGASTIDARPVIKSAYENRPQPVKTTVGAKKPTGLRMPEKGGQKGGAKWCF